MIEKLAEVFKREGANVIRYAWYQNGIIKGHEMVSSYPCSNCYSISKNFTATAIGIAYDMNLLDVEDDIVKYFENEIPLKHDQNLYKVKIKHLLSQTMGIAAGNLFESDRYTHGTDDFISVALSSDIPYEPGKKMVYSNSTYYLLSCIIEKVSGMTMNLFLQKYLFSKTGINSYSWECCPKGHTMGATGLYLSTTDMLKLGILYMNKGIFEGNKILSEKWVDMATVKRAGDVDNPTAFSFWFNDEGGYRGSGAYGQLLLVYPSRKMVFAAHSFDSNHNIYQITSKFLKEVN
ncbi:MAG: serine hydrolase [Clostridia bacterium]|nr:serine hydrolase [Clostridia bacterium]